MPYKRRRKKKSAYRKRRPYKKRGRMFKKKRGQYGKKKRYGNQTVCLFRGSSFLPQKYSCCHKIHAFLELDSEVGILTQVVVMNHIQNPFNFASPDERPVDGFAHMVAIYNQWRVTSLVWTLSSANFTATPHQVIVLPRQDTTPFTDDATMNQQPYAQSRLCGSVSGGKSNVFMRGSVNLDKLVGRKLVMDDEGLTSGIGTSESFPSQLMVLNILWSNFGTAPVDAIQANFHLSVTFNVTWWDREIIAISQ